MFDVMSYLLGIESVILMPEVMSFEIGKMGSQVRQEAKLAKVVFVVKNLPVLPAIVIWQLPVELERSRRYYIVFSRQVM